MTDPITQYEQAVQHYEAAQNDLKNIIFSKKSFLRRIVLIKKKPDTNLVQQLQKLFEVREQAIKAQSAVPQDSQQDPRFVDTEQTFQRLEQNLDRQLRRTRRIKALAIKAEQLSQKQGLFEKLLWQWLDCIPDWGTFLLLGISAVLTTNIVPLFVAGGPDLLGTGATVVQSFLSLLSLDKLVNGNAASEASTSRKKKAVPSLRKRWINGALMIFLALLAWSYFYKASWADHFYCSSDLYSRDRLSQNQYQNSSWPIPRFSHLFFFRSLWDQGYRDCLQDSSADIQLDLKDIYLRPDSEPDLKRAIAFDPQYANALQRLGWLYELRQDMDKAKEFYRLALQSPPQRGCWNQPFKSTETPSPNPKPQPSVQPTESSSPNPKSQPPVQKCQGKFQDGWFIARNRLATALLIEADTGGADSLKPKDNAKPKKEDEDKNKDKDKETTKQQKLADSAANILQGAFLVLNSEEFQQSINGLNEAQKKKAEEKFRYVRADLNSTLGWARTLQGPGRYPEAGQIFLDVLAEQRRHNFTLPAPLYCSMARLNEASANVLNRRQPTIELLTQKIESLQTNDKAISDDIGSLYPPRNSGKQIEAFEVTLNNLKDPAQGNAKSPPELLKELQRLEIGIRSRETAWLWCRCTTEINTSELYQDFWRNEAEQKKDKMCPKE
jgi:tetratricopeptide (TPR) repeat protein